MEKGQRSLGSSDKGSPQREKLWNWIWRPWYAKLWWITMPLYWLPAAGITGVKAIEDFYASGIGAYVNLIFSPLTAFLVLALGYLQRLFAETARVMNYSPAGTPPWRRPGYLEPTDDPCDPRSEWRWIHRRMNH